MMGRELAEKLKGEKPRLKVIIPAVIAQTSLAKDQRWSKASISCKSHVIPTNSCKLCGIAWIRSNTICSLFLHCSGGLQPSPFDFTGAHRAPLQKCEIVGGVLI